MKFATLFATLKKIRDFEKLHLPFVRSFIDFDIIIEIGYAQEQHRTFIPKQLFLMNIGSTTTVRRRLTALTELGIVRRRVNKRDHRSDFLTISLPTLKVMDKYGAVLSSLSVAAEADQR